jgi:hypothetical protein
MSSNDDKPFREMGMMEKITTVAIIALIILIPLSFVLGVTYFGFAGFLRLFGGEYDSRISLLLFVVFLFLLGLVLDLFLMGLVQLAKFYISGTYQLFAVKFLFNCTFSWLTIYTVDEFMNSITIPFTVEIIVVIFMFFLEEALEQKET